MHPLEINDNGQVAAAAHLLEHAVRYILSLYLIFLKKCKVFKIHSSTFQPCLGAPLESVRYKAVLL